MDFPPAVSLPFPVVGLGASAGGLAAFEAFFSGLPLDRKPGMAFILVQHLAPDHQSRLAELIRGYTQMQVLEVSDGLEIQPNCVYIIPPNCDLALLKGRLQLYEPAAPRGQRLPIDFFFSSLARELHQHAICIVLSGTGADGSVGLRAIKEAGGLVLVQELHSAEYDGMPRSAIATGLVDFELLPKEMPERLMAYVETTFTHLAPVLPLQKPKLSQDSDTGFLSGSESESDPEPGLNTLFSLLSVQTGHDFSQYKPNTLSRRIERRLALHQLKTLDEYVAYAQAEPAEINALFRDLLIGVTHFFRDPDAFQVLEKQVIPQLFANLSEQSTIRVWVPACSTGEEAYSLAILLAEQQALSKQNPKVQIFATDIDKAAIATARAGVYPLSTTAGLSAERLARFFSIEPPSADQDQIRYRIHKNIRNMLIFSEQDLIKDPPFSRLDLISCRNLLIYMGAALQKKLIPLFHYALNPSGFLFLGTSETVGDAEALFSTEDRKEKIYRRKPDSRQRGLKQFVSPVLSLDLRFSPVNPQKGAQGKLSLRELTEQALLQNAVPAAALVKKNGDILYLHGRTGFYLEPAQGEAGVNNMIKMAREGLGRDLTLALHKASQHAEVVRCYGLRVKTNGDYTLTDLKVYPLMWEPGEGREETLFLVLLEQAKSAENEYHGLLPQAGDKRGARAEVGSETVSDSGSEARIHALKQELQAKEDFLSTINEELETANEELKASNEEMQSMNEELQSTNEELETAKEELQSINEELATINTELQAKVTDLSRVNNDMNNLLAGTGIATVFVDHDLHILRFTPAATRIINLIQSDMGRPVAHIVSNLVGYDQLSQDIQRVLDTLIPVDVEVQSKAGKWFAMHILPYRTLENVIEGAVITFVDIQTAKQDQAALADTITQTFNAMMAIAHQPLLLLSDDLRIRLANSAFGRFFELEPEAVIGQLIFDLEQQEWDIPALRVLFEQYLSQSPICLDYVLSHSFKKIGLRVLSLNARRIVNQAGHVSSILLAIEEVLPQKLVV
jgi:two-component system CheB/CheR fusion protein